MNYSDQFRQNCGGDLISYTQGESVFKAACMYLVGLVLAGVVIMTPTIWPQAKKPPVVSATTSSAPQGEQMGSWVHGPEFPSQD